MKHIRISLDIYVKTFFIQFKIKKTPQLGVNRKMVPPARIELAIQAYHACVIPLNYGGFFLSLRLPLFIVSIIKEIINLIIKKETKKKHNKNRFL